MEASKVSIEVLERSISEANQELFASIIDDISVHERCDETTPILLRDVLELRMDVKFILVDLQTSMQICFASSKAYEKRYHLKNLYAGMLEGYKLLYGFGKMRKHTIWARIKEDLLTTAQKNKVRSDLFDAFIRLYENITEQLRAIESTRSDQDNRNLTFHYDDDLLLVYRLTLKTDSEEKAAQKYIEYMKVLSSMLEFSYLVERTEALTGVVLPSNTGNNDEIFLLLLQKIADTFRKHPLLPTVLSSAVDQGAKQLDSFADYKIGVNNIDEYINRSIVSMASIPEIGIMKQLLDIQMLLTFMMADISTILLGFIGADCKVEHPLLLRRLTISRVSALSHLVGYKDGDSNSMWRRITDVIPSDNQKLLNEAYEITQELKTMRKSGDCDARALYIHLIDNNTFNSNIPAIVKNLSDISIISEIGLSQKMVTLYGKISRFLAKLMSALSELAKKSRIESTMQIKKQMDEIRVLASHPKCPNELRESLRQQMDKLERIVELDN